MLRNSYQILLIPVQDCVSSSGESLKNIYTTFLWFAVAINVLTRNRTLLVRFIVLQQQIAGSGNYFLSENALWFYLRKKWKSFVLCCRNF